MCCDLAGEVLALTDVVIVDGLPCHRVCLLDAPDVKTRSFQGWNWLIKGSPVLSQANAGEGPGILRWAVEWQLAKPPTTRVRHHNTSGSMRLMRETTLPRRHSPLILGEFLDSCPFANWSDEH